MAFGKGTKTWADGAQYVGEFKNDRRDGEGEMAEDDCSNYNGTWKDDKKNGLGTFTWPSGAQYVG